MTVYAYRVTARIDDGVDMTSDSFRDAVDAMRDDVRTRVRQMGGDPLPHEQVALHADADAHEVHMVWRSRVIQPDDGRLAANVREQARQADTIVSWRLDYHRCGNGTHRPCKPWQTLVEEESR